MNKYRPEEITLKTPSVYADHFEEWLREDLHRNARIERNDLEGGNTRFSFYPTRSEYLYVQLMLGVKSEFFKKQVG